MKRIRSHRELDVYKMSFNASMKLFEISKGFPREEQYSLTDQIRRSSRSVSANITEAFRKRKYPNPGLFTKKFCCEQGEVEKVTEGYTGTLSKLFSMQRSSRENFAALTDTLTWVIVLFIHKH